MTMRVAPRSKVMVFAERLEMRLRENDDKGGWAGMPASEMLMRLKQEVLELDYEIAVAGAHIREVSVPRIIPDNAAYVVQEALDVAAFCLMLVDAHGGLTRASDVKKVAG